MTWRESALKEKALRFPDAWRQAPRLRLSLRRNLGLRLGGKLLREDRRTGWELDQDPDG
jgi:hypothetical protein